MCGAKRSIIPRSPLGRRTIRKQFPSLRTLTAIFMSLTIIFAADAQQTRLVKKLERLEIAQLRISHRLPFQIGLVDPETAPTISLSPSYRCIEGSGSKMLWARLLAYVTGTVNQELLLRNEYLAAENRILRGQIKGRLLLSEEEKAT